jgi:N-acetylmuramoyl-L-alanine amidase
MNAPRFRGIVTALGVLTALGTTAGTRSAAFAAPARRAANAPEQGRKAASAPNRSGRATAVHPDAALYQDAQAAEARLRASSSRLKNESEWEATVLRYRKVVARYPRSGYCDNALLAAGNLYREMATRFNSSTYREDSLATYRMLVAEYPSSSLGDDALFAVVEVSRQVSDRRKLTEAARAYLDAYPEGSRAAGVKKLLRQREPATPLPSPPPHGLARVFDLRSWSGDNSTRVVIDVERKLELRSDVANNPDRLWVDLLGARLHPNLARRVFPVGDGLLEQVRIAQNRDDVVRVVLDFKDVWEHQVFYLTPTRLVIDVRGHGRAGVQVAEAASASPPSDTRPASSGSPQGSPSSVPSPASPAQPSTGAPGPALLPSRRVNGMVPADATLAPAVATATPIAITGVDRLPISRPAPPPAARPPAPEGPPVRQTTLPARPAADPAPSVRDAALPTRPPEPPVANRAGSYSLARQLGLGARRIVIDAGHGGHDPGTIGRRGLQEKELVLDVALRLDRLVRQELGAEVVLTRSTDVFIPLEERTAIANSRGADLFLSVHANASRNAGARGIETYFLNFARSTHAEEVAARENAISPATLKDLQNLVKAIATNSKIDESRDFAAAVQESMVAGVRQQHDVSDRGVHTAPFYVLIGANMPAVLAEIAFVTNPDDEKLLRDTDYREMIARNLLRGVRTYLDALNRTQMRQLTDGSRRSTVEGGRGGR